MALTGSQIPLFNTPVQLEVRNQVLKIQAEEMKNTEQNLEILEKDLNTQRRQVEIIQNSSLIKSNHIFILKTILSALALLTIPLILHVKQILDKTPFLIITGVIAGLVALVLYYNLVSVYNRDPNRFNNRRFDEKNTMAVSNKPLKCVTNETKRLNSLQKETRDKEAELDALEQKIIELDIERQTLIDKKKNNLTKDAELERQFILTFPSDNIQRELSIISGAGPKDGKFSIGVGGGRLR
jgi:hypothetical protein